MKMLSEFAYLYNVPLTKRQTGPQPFENCIIEKILYLGLRSSVIILDSFLAADNSQSLSLFSSRSPQRLICQFDSL